MKTRGYSYRRTDSTRKKMSISALKRGANNKGCVRSADHKMAVSRAQMGNKHRKGVTLKKSSIEKRKMSMRIKEPYFIALNKEGIEVYSGNSQKECSLLLFGRKSTGNIGRVLKNLRKTYLKHTFKYI